MPVVLSIELCSGAYWGKAPVVAVDVVSYTLGLYSIIGMEYSFILFTMPKQKYPVFEHATSMYQNKQTCFPPLTPSHLCHHTCSTPSRSVYYPFLCFSTAKPPL